MFYVYKKLFNDRIVFIILGQQHEFRFHKNFLESNEGNVKYKPLFGKLMTEIHI